MSQEVATQQGQDLVGTDQDRGVYRAGEESDFTPKERERLRALGGLDDASDADLAMLFEVANRADLDPFLKEIYLIGRKTKTKGYRGEPDTYETKWTVQTSIDGLRKVLFRYAKSEGKAHSIGAPVFYNAEGRSFPFWMGAWGNPAAVSVEVAVGESVGHGLATWDEFVQTKYDGEPTAMWSKMGPTMLAKCAKAQGIRDVCSLAAGLYVDEEMGQANNRVVAKAKRMDTGARGLSAIAAATQPGIPSEPVGEEPVSEEDAEFVESVKAELAKCASVEEVESFMAELKQDPSVPEAALVAGRDRWKEVTEAGEQ
ncbi:recombinase RecT [Corynebacterium flavescens]|uniref:recombinase RecT n=1 Tax=Corynebacterium flavescens TaxID=28028 RepID=UPI003FD59BA6